MFLVADDRTSAPLPTGAARQALRYLQGGKRGL
jgi:hypothetical protein